jgi:Uncharacterized protein conserved in archaea
MPGRAPASDESVMMRWMQQEIRRMNASVVTARKTLGTLCKEESPSAKTRGGGEHVFNRKILRLLQEQTPPGLVDRLQLPILFYLDMDVPDAAYLTDEIAVKVLQVLGEISLLRIPREGRIWVSRPIAYAILRKYPTLIQVVMG